MPLQNGKVSQSAVHAYFTSFPRPQHNGDNFHNLQGGSIRVSYFMSSSRCDQWGERESALGKEIICA